MGHFIIFIPQVDIRAGIEAVVVRTAIYGVSFSFVVFSF